MYCTGIGYTDIGDTPGIHGINKRGNARVTTVRRVHVPIVAVEKQYVLHIPIVCSLGIQHAKRMPRIVAICGLCFLDSDMW